MTMPSEWCGRNFTHIFGQICLKCCAPVRRRASIYWQRDVHLKAAKPLPFALLLYFFSNASLHAEDTNVQEEIQALQKQNAILEQQVEKQNESIQALTEKVQRLQATNATQESASAENSPSPATPSGYNFGNVNLSGTGAVGFFDTGPEGFAPDGEFRVAEARLFVEAPVWKNVYFQGEADLATFDNPGVNVQLGEVYLDWQDLSDLWGRDGQLNLRVGRMYIPFGEEYLYRYAIDNPLISHSVSDLWGYSPGIEIYGQLGKFDYAVAGQNGGLQNGKLTGFDNGKSAAGRVGYDPNQHLHFSVSAMRTGNLNAVNGTYSAIWFGSGFFQSLGGPGTTWFHVNLVEGDVIANWPSGSAHAFGGYGRYNDNDPLANNGRNIFYYSVEGMQNLPKKFYVAARFSEALSNEGVPIIGFGNPAEYSDILARELWRLSLGLGYRFSGNFILKTEYSFEGGHDIDGESRNQESFFGTEAAFKF